MSLMPAKRLAVDKAYSALHLRLLAVQRRLASQGRPAVILVGGNDRLSASSFANRLQEWFDSRTVEVCAPLEGDPSSAGRPFLWPYWMRMPAKGRILVVVGDWVTRTAIQATRDELEREDLRIRLKAIRQFEETLLANGVALAKIWLTTTRKSLRRRLRDAEDTDAEGWVVTEDDLRLSDGKGAKAATDCRRHASPTGHAWHKVPAAEFKRRDLLAGRSVVDQLNRKGGISTKALRPSRLRPRGLLDHVVHSEMDRDEYGPAMRKWQARLGRLSRLAAKRGVPAIVVLEGPDAAGKGGAIRRLCAQLDAGLVSIHSIPAPTPDEKSRHYLWRFWNKVPAAGHLAIFDRSWYGRVLVERVEGFAKPAEWQRAYAEINAFEAELAASGAIVIKFWLHLSKDEQLRRFRSREDSPHKRHKMTAEDYRNRAKWDVNLRAAEDMVSRTDTPHAPWVVVPADDKRSTRVTVLRAVTRAFADRLER